MKRSLPISLFTSLLLVLTACQSVDEKLSEKAEPQKIPVSKDGVTLEAGQKKYNTSTKELSAKLYNDGDEVVATGRSLTLEKKVEGIWYHFPRHVAEDLISFKMDPGSQDTFTIEVSDWEYSLTPGKYRFRKEGVADTFTVIDK